MSWVTLSESQIDGRSIRLRFVPDTLAPEHETPVVEVTIEDVEHPDEVLGIVARFHDDFIVDLRVMEQSLHLVAEMDYTETVIRGSRVYSRAVEYSKKELLAIATSLQQALKREASYAYLQSAKLRDIRHFVADLIERARKRQALSKKTVGATESQLSVLSRVLHRLDNV